MDLRKKCAKPKPSESRPAASRRQARPHQLRKPHFRIGPESSRFRPDEAPGPIPVALPHRRLEAPARAAWGIEGVTVCAGDLRGMAHGLNSASARILNRLEQNKPAFNGVIMVLLMGMAQGPPQLPAPVRANP